MFAMSRCNRRIIYKPKKTIPSPARPSPTHLVPFVSKHEQRAARSRVSYASSPSCKPLPSSLPPPLFPHRFLADHLALREYVGRYSSYEGIVGDASSVLWLGRSIFLICTPPPGQWTDPARCGRSREPMPHRIMVSSCPRPSIDWHHFPEE